MRRALLLIALATSLPAGAVVGGAADPGDDAVVALNLGDFTVCSGVLVAPNAVLTAGHCLPPLGSMEVRFGPDALHPVKRVKIEDQLTHPQYTKEGAGYDFALLKLKDPVTDVQPVALSTASLSASDVGRDVRHVGFGVDNEADGTGRGVKRQVSYPVTEVTELTFFSGATGQQTCDGDSGGAALFDDGTLAGIVSDGPSCHEDGWDGRVDVVAPWISDQLTAWKPPSPDVVPPAEKSGCGGAALIPALLLALVWRQRTSV